MANAIHHLSLAAEDAIPDRIEPMIVPNLHYVNHNNLSPPYPQNMTSCMFGMGCFWGAEKLFWQLEGVYITAVGYAGGYTANPHYGEVCSGMTGHAEVVKVVFSPQEISFNKLLKVFWEGHDPTQGMRQGNDVGSQYRSTIYCTDENQLTMAKTSNEIFQKSIATKKLGTITSEIKILATFYFAEPEHQQYLAKNPHGYCGLGGTGCTYSES